MNFTCNGLFYLSWLPGHHFVGFMVRSVLELGRGSACEAYPIYIRGFSENLEQFHLGKIQSGSSGWICVVWGWEGGFMKWSQVPLGVGWSGLLGDGSSFYGKSTYLKRGTDVTTQGKYKHWMNHKLPNWTLDRGRCFKRKCGLSKRILAGWVKLNLQKTCCQYWWEHKWWGKAS